MFWYGYGIPLRYRLALAALGLAVFGLLRVFSPPEEKDDTPNPAIWTGQDEETAEYHFDRGMAALKANDADRAVACFDKAIELDPQDPAFFVSRGTAYDRKKDHDRALADFAEAIRLDPKYSDAYCTRGMSSAGRKDYEGALTDFDTAIRLDGSQASFYTQRSYAYLGKGDFDRALADAAEAVQLDPNGVEGHNVRGRIYEQQKEYEKAVAEYGESIRLNPRDTQAYDNLARLWATCPKEENRNGKMAVDYARFVCQSSGWKDPSVFPTLAAAYAETGQFDEAVKWQKKAMDSPDSWNDQGEVQQAQARLKLYEDHQPLRSE